MRIQGGSFAQTGSGLRGAASGRNRDRLAGAGLSTAVPAWPADLPGFRAKAR
jgi:hypothetical protein